MSTFVMLFSVTAIVKRFLELLHSMALQQHVVRQLTQIVGVRHSSLVLTALFESLHNR